VVPAPDEGQPGETKPFKVLSPGTVISHYKIAEKIGEGGMGVVYKARDTKLDRTVALKFLPPRMLCDSEARERFEHEAKAASALNHPSIATIFEIDEEDGRCFIAMEYLEGGSLKGLLKAQDLSLKEILNLAIQIGEGLGAAHESGVTHRDMKPDNIMLTRKGRAKIMDFGLAKLKGATRVTKTGTTLGTLQYMSPEQAGGEAFDSRSDIFSFGVILYEMVTGRLPFRGDNEAAVINSILNDTPEPLARYKADLPEGLQRIVDRALTKDPHERYQHADDMVAELRHEKRLLETGTGTATQTRETRPAPGRRLLPILIPATIVVAAIILILIFEPFRVEMGPGREVLAQENSLAVMYFENMVDPEDGDRTAQMLTALLITDLSESKYIRVLSRQRLYDLLSLLGKGDLSVIDKTVASQVAEKAGVKWILTGSVLQTEPSITLVSEISDAETGEILASQRTTAEVDEDLFSLADRLSAQIKQDLSLPEQARTEQDMPVADVTTHSAEAYRYYLEGCDYLYKLYGGEARESFEKALEFDSTFAMAYYQLADLTGGSVKEEMIAKSLAYSDRASWKERQFIEARAARLSDDTQTAIERLRGILERYPEEKRAYEALGWIHREDLRQPEQAAFYFEKVIEIDPLDKNAYNILAYIYDTLGDFEKSIWAINRYVALAPDEANPYDTRGDLYSYQGKLDLAADSYRKALELKPDFYTALEALGRTYIFKREYVRAESCYQVLASCPNAFWRSAGRTYHALIPLHQGKLEDAFRALEHGMAVDRLEQQWMHFAFKRALTAFIQAERGNFDLALEAFEMCVELAREANYDAPGYVREYKVQLLARAGDFDEAGEVAEVLRRDIEEYDELDMGIYWHAAGWIDFERGDYKASVAAFEKSLENEKRSRWRYMLGRAYLESGRLGEAVTTFEKVLSRYSDARLLFLPIEGVKAHYFLGLAYEQSGWTKKAVEQYEEFLDIWKDADPGITEIEDARQRLARLKSGA
jgi:tetratricopeptide (TPR) repeat protein/tRNA A-37 threonylcarbamoyl transferase component Bud32